MDVFIIFYLSMEITPVILSAAKDLCARRARSFAALRMTARTPLTFSHEKSYLQMSGGGTCTIDFFLLRCILYYPSFLDMLTQAVVVMLDVRWQATVLMGFLYVDKRLFGRMGSSPFMYTVLIGIMSKAI